MMHRWTQSALLRRFRQSTSIERVLTRTLERLDRLLSPFAQHVPMAEWEESETVEVQATRPTTEREPKPVVVNRTRSSSLPQDYRRKTILTTPSPVSTDLMQRNNPRVSVDVVAWRGAISPLPPSANHRIILAISLPRQIAEHQGSLMTSADRPINNATSVLATMGSGSGDHAEASLPDRHDIEPVDIASGSEPVTPGLPTTKVSLARRLESISTAIATVRSEKPHFRKDEALKPVTPLLTPGIDLQAPLRSEIMTSTTIAATGMVRMFSWNTDTLAGFSADLIARPPRRLYRWAADYLQFIAQRRVAIHPVTLSETTAWYLEHLWRLAQQPWLDEPPAEAVAPPSEQWIEPTSGREESWLAPSEIDPSVLPRSQSSPVASSTSLALSKRLPVDEIAAWLGTTAHTSSGNARTQSVDAFLNGTPSETTGQTSLNQPLPPVLMQSMPWLPGSSLSIEAPTSAIPSSGWFTGTSGLSETRQAEHSELSIDPVVCSAHKLNTPSPPVGGQWERMRSQKKWRKHGLDRPRE